jgi:hypothetical protein
MPVTITLRDSVAKQLENQASQQNVSLEQWAVEVLLRQSQSDVSGSSQESGPWTDERNARRCDLIDRQIEGTITAVEIQELDELQTQLRRHLEQSTPFDMAGAQRIHQQLLQKKRDTQIRREASGGPV